MLNGRGVLDPRWAYFARPVVRGTMWADITVYRAVKLADDNWNPFDSDTNKRAYTGGFTYKNLYVGPARLQPNNDWRARQYRVEGELVTEHAARIQLDLTANTIKPLVPLPHNPLDSGETSLPDLPGDSGLLRAKDLVRVDRIANPYKYPVDSLSTGFRYEVRVVSASSNSWVRTLLCDFVAQHVQVDND